MAIDSTSELTAAADASVEEPDSQDADAPRDVQTSLDGQVVLIMLGSTALVASLISYLVFDSSEQPAMLAMLAAILLGAPVTINTLKGIFGNSQQQQHTEELVMLAFLASFAAARYVEAASIALFMLIASLIVNRTAAGARSTIESLIRVSPKLATRKVNGSEEQVDATTLTPGDQVVVRPGDQVPCDGRVLSGLSSLDEKYITGESHPVDKNAGDIVFAGSFNLTGLLTIEVEKPLAESTLGKVQSLIQDAANYKTPVTKLLDQFTSYYTPLVLCIAGIVLFATRDLSLVISLLLIACPM
ncbi:MAG: HAD-IC family P-type ATPase, partial [Planctomycetota bacterium]